MSITIIGGGIIGCSAAYHLLKAGATQVTVLEAGRAGGATSSAGAGFVAQWSVGMMPNLGSEGLALQKYSIEFYKELAASEHDIGYRANGTLVLALTKEGYDRNIQVVLGSPLAPAGMRTLDPDEIAEVTAGVVDPEAVYGAVLNPHGIQIETGPTISAIASEVRRLGGEILEQTRVTEINDRANGRVELITDNGSIGADQVVIAAGAWTNEILASLSLRLPLLRTIATRVVSNDLGLPSTIPTINCREIPLWLRESRGRLTWGTTDGYRALYQIESEGYHAPFGQPRHPELVEALQQRRLSQLEGIFPALSRSSVESWQQGYPCYTPDLNLIIGALPDHECIFVMAGDNEVGVTHAPGMGRLVTQLLLGETPFVDASPYRPDRFNMGEFPDEESIGGPFWLRAT